jgi:hypothetical protein
VIGVGYRILLLITIFCLLQRWSLTLAAVAVFLAGALLTTIGIGAFAWMGALAAALIAILLAAAPDNSKRALCAGIAAGLGLLFRFDLAPAMFLCLLPSVLAMSGTGRRRFLAGTGVAMLPYAALTIAAGCGQVWNNLFLFPVVYSSPGRHIPFGSASPEAQRLLIAHCLSTALNFAVAVTLMRAGPQRSESRVLVMLSLLAAGLTPQAVQRLDMGHVAPAALVSITVLSVSLAAGYAFVRNQTGRLIRSTVAASLVTLGLAAFIPRLAIGYSNQLRASLNWDVCYAVWVQNQGRSFPVGSPQLAEALTRVLDRLNHLATPGQRLFVGPGDLRRTNYNDTFIYHLLPQLRPGTYFLEMNPLSANRLNSRLAGDIARSDWLILTNLWDSWHEPNDSMKFGSELPNLTIEQKFDLCFQNQFYSLYRRR